MFCDFAYICNVCIYFYYALKLNLYIKSCITLLFIYLLSKLNSKYDIDYICIFIIHFFPLFIVTSDTFH